MSSCFEVTLAVPSNGLSEMLIPTLPRSGSVGEADTRLPVPVCVREKGLKYKVKV